MNTANGFGLADAEDAKAAQKSLKEGQIPENDCSREMIGASMEVQRVRDVGLLESACSAARQIELAGGERAFVCEVPTAAADKGHLPGQACRADFTVGRSVFPELKPVEGVNDLHRAQLLSCLRLSGRKLGLLSHFPIFSVVRGVHRTVNKL